MSRAVPRPAIVVLGGPNGAGKSTVAPSLLRFFGVETFVNADGIALGLSALRPECRAFDASRLMLQELNRLAEARESFAFETTLATRSVAPWIHERIEDGFRFILAYIWVNSDDLAVQRVAARVRAGGHDIPEQTIRRRWKRSTMNLRSLYLPMANRWYVYDNSTRHQFRRIAMGGVKKQIQVLDVKAWSQLESVN